MPLNFVVVSYPTTDQTVYFRSIKKFIKQKARDRPINKQMPWSILVPREQSIQGLGHRGHFSLGRWTCLSRKVSP